MHDDHRDAGAAQARARSPGRHAPGARARPVEAGVGRPQEGSGPGADRAPEADRRVRRRGAAGPEGGRRPHRGRARRASPIPPAPRRSCSGAPSSSSASPTRPARSRRRSPPWTARCAGSASRATRRAGGKPSAVEQLLGGTRRRRRPRTRARRSRARRLPRVPRCPPRLPRPTARRPTPRPWWAGCSAGLIQSAGAGRRHRHAGRVRGARDRLPPGRQPDQHPGRGAATAAGTHAPLVGGADQRRGPVLPLPLRAGRPADRDRQQPRGRARLSSTRSPTVRSSPSSSTGPAAGSSATRPAATSAITWRSCSTAASRDGRR